MSYRVSFKASADKALDKLPKAIAARIIEKAIALGDDPRPSGCVKLAGGSEMWRVRIGGYRMAYMIDDGRQTVDIRIVAHRREVYRGL
jgi:mRNA interferase RelE/StbE